MKTRILAFVALLMIATAWHFFLLNQKPMSPAVQMNEAVVEPADNVRNPAEAQPQSSQPASGASLELSAQSTVSQLAHLRTCLDSQTCAYPNSDPRSYELAVNESARQALRALTTEVKNKHWRNEALRKLALEALQWQDDRVRLQALELVSTQDPSSQTLKHMMESVRQSHDPALFKMTLQELQRYTSTEDRGQIEDFLFELIRSGSFHSAPSVAGNLAPFLSETNVARFESLLTQMQPGTQRQRALQRSLAEYSRR